MGSTPNPLNEDLHFNKIATWFTCICKFENHSGRWIARRRHLGAYCMCLLGWAAFSECNLWAFFSLSFLCQFSSLGTFSPTNRMVCCSCQPASSPPQPRSLAAAHSLCSAQVLCVLKEDWGNLSAGKGLACLKHCSTFDCDLCIYTAPLPAHPLLYPALLSHVDIHGEGSSRQWDDDFPFHIVILNYLQVMINTFQ